MVVLSPLLPSRSLVSIHMVGVQLTLLALAMSSAVNAVQNYCACTGNTAVTVKDFVMVVSHYALRVAGLISPDRSLHLLQGGAKTVVSSPDDCGAACTAFGPTCKFGGEMKSGEYSGYCWLWTFSSTGAQVTAKSDAENVWSYMVFKGTCTESVQSSHEVCWNR